MYWLNLFTWWLYISFILYFFKLNPFNPFPFFIIILLRDIFFVIFNSINTKTSPSKTTFISVFKFLIILLVHYLPLYYLHKINKNNKYVQTKKKKIK